MTDLQERSEKLIAEMKGARGYLPPEWEYCAREDPAFMEAYNNLYSVCLNDGEALSAKTRELVAIGILSFRGRPDGVKSHIKRAIRLGATRREVFEAVEVSIVPGGAPTLNCGLQAMIAAFKELDAK